MKKLYGDDYSGNHIAIFECELKAPPQMAFIDHTYEGVIDAYRVNFRNWRIVDIDNFMEGNHFFSEVKEEEVWQKEANKCMGGAEMQTWMEKESESPTYERDVLIPIVGGYIKQIEELDTKSNRLMSPLHKKRAEILSRMNQSQK